MLHTHTCTCVCLDVQAVGFIKCIMKTSVQSPLRHQGPLECGDTTTMLSGAVKATANSTFYTVFMVICRKIMAAAVFLSLFIPIIYHSFSMIVLQHR